MSDFQGWLPVMRQDKMDVLGYLPVPVGLYSGLSMCFFKKSVPKISSSDEPTLEKIDISDAILRCERTPNVGFGSTTFLDGRDIPLSNLQQLQGWVDR